MAFMSMASRSEVMEAVLSLGNWRGAGCDLVVDSRGLGPLSDHIVTVLTPQEEEGDGWMDRGLLLVELASLRSRFRNVSYRVEVVEGSKKDTVHP
jgi:hypothetical protein